MTYNADTGFAGTTFGERFSAFRAALADKAAKRKVYRTTYNELSTLTDRDLNDLGLSRSMIKGVSLEAAYGK